MTYRCLHLVVLPTSFWLSDMEFCCRLFRDTDTDIDTNINIRIDTIRSEMNAKCVNERDAGESRIKYLRNLFRRYVFFFQDTHKGRIFIANSFFATFLSLVSSSFPSLNMEGMAMCNYL